MPLTGTPSQIEWAEQIRVGVGLEFDRVAAALLARRNTGEIRAILEEKRAETMANTRSGYFILEWQELSDQIRTMIAADPRYQVIKARKENTASCQA